MSVIAPQQVDLGTAEWTIDPDHSEVGFTVRHLMSKVRGQFATFTGTIKTAGAPEASSVQVRIESGSITTNNAQRDGHLRSADFFDPTKGGELTFVSTGIRAVENGYVISGNLTINAITKPVELAAEFLGTEVDGYGQTKLGAEATTTIDRRDFDVTWNMPLDGGKYLVGNKVDISLAIQASRA